MEKTSSRHEVGATVFLSVAITAVLAVFFLPATAIMCELMKSPFPTRRYAMYWCAFAALVTLGSCIIDTAERRLPPLMRSRKKRTENAL